LLALLGLNLAAERRGNSEFRETHSKLAILTAIMFREQAVRRFDIKQTSKSAAETIHAFADQQLAQADSLAS